MKWIFIIIDILVFVYIIKELYVMSHMGKLILEIQHKKHTASHSILIIGILLTISIVIGQGIDYLKGNQIDYLTLFKGMAIIESGLYMIIIKKQSLVIRENGVCLGNVTNSTSFYKWNQILNYEWVSSNEIEFEITTVFKKTINRYLKIENQNKEYIDELLKKHIN